MTKYNDNAPAAKVSVIVPSYNHEKFVANAIRSALDQTVSEIELIVIDDGSTDRSPLILDDLAHGEPRMKVVRQENSGSHAAINHGLRLASAPWVAILNSDDEWESNRLEVMLGAAGQSGAGFLFSDTVLIDAEGRPIEDRLHWWNLSQARVRQRMLEHGVVEGLLYGNLAVSTSNFLFRRDVLEKVGWFRPFKYNLDWDFVLRCAFDAAVKVFFVHAPLLKYRLHGENAILVGMPLAAIEAQNITRRVYRDYYGAPQSLSLSHFRHDRLLRKYLNDKSKRYAASCESITADRDRIAKLLEERQSLIEAERKEVELRLAGLAADLSAMEASRDELGALLSSRQAAIDKERAAHGARVDALLAEISSLQKHQSRSPEAPGAGKAAEDESAHEARMRGFAADYSALEADRDKLAALLASRQAAVDEERAAYEARLQGLASDLSAVERDRDRLAELMVSRQVMVENEREAHEARLERLASDLSAVERDRDRIAGLLASRQVAIDKERAAHEIQLRNWAYDFSAMAQDRDALAALLTSRQAIIEAERFAHKTSQARDRLLLEDSYQRSVEIAFQRDRAARRVARMAEASTRYQTQLVVWRNHLSGGFRQRVKDIVRRARRPSLPVTMDAGDVEVAGHVIEAPRHPVSKHVGAKRIAAHVHLYYKDLASELLEPLLHIPDLHRVVITGPWDAEDLEPSLGALRAYCPNVCVAKIPNRGKDIGGLVYAIEHERLLDSDYLLKIHSKRSRNPSTYFDAISALFGMRIEDGDQWRRALVAPLIGSAQRIKEIVHWFDSDPSLGMIGAGAFVTTAPDANTELYRKVCSSFGIPCGMPFVAGTMFWVRSSLLAPLLQGVVKFDDFDVDSREVEGGLEHVMERIFGAFALANGFDLLKVGS
ncbi:MAG TPA: glycosyltransferase [Acidobacteriaceae bacterium]|nr:glycosyltransferase [Acidobacteriaceae bacterium]